MPPRDYFLGATSEQFLGLLGELQNASDRVTAIAAAAFLDDTLGAALLSRFVNVGSTWKDRLFSAPNAPFGSFYSKVIAGYALGLFGPQTYADLDLIRKVRNEFAHTATPLRFADEAMAAMCNRLTTPSRIKMGLGTLFLSEPGPKAQYARAIYGIAIALSGQMSASKSSRPFPSYPSHRRINPRDPAVFCFEFWVKGKPGRNSRLDHLRRYLDFLVLIQCGWRVRNVGHFYILYVGTSTG